jgi:hypothetical protein
MGAHQEDRHRDRVRDQRRVISVLAIGLMAALAIGAGSSGASSRKPAPPKWVLHGPYNPSINPADFVATIDNRYFPLTPGTTFHFRGYSDTTPQTDDVVVTHQTKEILGIRCTVVRDTVSEHGKAVERTFDWYAQDKHRNVWYMGENSLELKHGRLVRASDSWKAGVNGGKPGIIMEGDPQRGDVYRQEYYPPGGGLDQARVLGTVAKLKVLAGTYKAVLSTIEWSPVEPQLEKKYYAAGVGEIQEQVAAGGHERFQLVRVTH